MSERQYDHPMMLSNSSPADYGKHLPRLWWDTVRMQAERMTTAIRYSVSNPMNSLWMPQQNQWLGEPNFLKENSFMTTTDDNILEGLNGGVDAATFFGHPDWTRSLILMNGKFPVRSQMGSLVYVKGVNVTGLDYKQDYNVQNQPWGFFGDRDAEFEMQFSNLLLENGARTTYVTGYVVYDADKLAGLFSDSLKYSSNLLHRVLKSLNQVVANGDEPASIFRIAGNRSRLDENNTYNASTRRRLFDMMSGATVMLQEAEMFPDATDKYLTGKHSAESYKASLQKIAQGQQLSRSQMEPVIDFYVGVIAANARAIDKMRRDCKARHLLGDKIDHKLARIGNATDIDLTMMMTDFEMYREAGYTGGKPDPATSYNRRMSSVISRWLNLFFGRYFSTTSKEFSSDDIRTRIQKVYEIL